MADTQRSGDLAAADDGLAVEGVPPRRRRGLRITLVSPASVIVPILLLHIDAGNRAAGVVSIPAGTVVNVPGHGRGLDQAAKRKRELRPSVPGGVNQIGGIEALEYTGDPALTEAGRALRQQYLTARSARSAPQPWPYARGLPALA